MIQKARCKIPNKNLSLGLVHLDSELFSKEAGLKTSACTTPHVGSKPTVQLLKVDFDGSKPFYWISPLLFTLNPSELRNTDLSFWKAGLYRVARMQKKIRVFILITSSMRSAWTGRALTLETLCWAVQKYLSDFFLDLSYFLPRIKWLLLHNVIWSATLSLNLA